MLSYSDHQKITNLGFGRDLTLYLGLKEETEYEY